jgi:hypothetical protein
MKIVVYTAIFSNGQSPYDVLRPAPFGDEVRHVCFTDAPQGVEGWEEVQVERLFQDPKREFAMYLALPHLWFADVDYSILHGGSGELLQHPGALVELLEGKGGTLATFRHPTRDCVYQEAEAVIRYGKAAPELVHAQMQAYRDAGYPEHGGLGATGLTVRRHCDETARFNEFWWSQMCRWTARDQLSLDYSRWRTWTRWRPIPGGSNNIDRVGPNDYVVHHGHK